MTQLLTSDYAHSVIQLITGSSISIDVLAYIVNCNLYKKSDKMNLIFLELKYFLARGGKVRFVLDYPRPHKPNYHPLKFFTRRFKEAGFFTRYLHSGTTQHAKLLLFDNKTAVLGSHNLATKSVINVHDLSVIIEDAALVTWLRDYFDNVWSKSVEA